MCVVLVSVQRRVRAVKVNLFGGGVCLSVRKRRMVATSEQRRPLYLRYITTGPSRTPRA